MGALKNTVDLGLALAWDMGTSTTRFHRHLHSYYQGRFKAKEATDRHPVINPRLAALTAQAHFLWPQIFLSAIVDITAQKNGVDLPILLTMASTVMATNGPVMRVFDKLAADYDQLKNSYDDFFVKLGATDLPPLKVEYDKQSAYPNFRATLRRIRDGGGDGSPPSSNDDEQRPEL